MQTALLYAVCIIIKEKGDVMRSRIVVKVGVLMILVVSAFLLSWLIIMNQRSSSTFQLVRLGQENSYLFPVYTNYVCSARDIAGVSVSALVPDPTLIETVVIVQHGISRNASYYSKALGKAYEQADTPQDKTLIIAPHFFAQPFSKDECVYATLLKKCSVPVWKKQEWSQGCCSLKGAKISSFTVYDDLLAALANNQDFSALKKIIFIGHSAGGQCVHRYAILNDVCEKHVAAGYEISYVIANPSSYLYFTDERQTSEGFVPYDLAFCPLYNSYKYGLEGVQDLCYKALFTDGVKNISSSLSLVDAQVLFTRFAQRSVHYVLSMDDTEAYGLHLDSGCEAQAQGKNRYERGRSYCDYEQYLSSRWGALLNHTYCLVPAVGHDKDLVFLSQCVNRALFKQ